MLISVLQIWKVTFLCKIVWIQICCQILSKMSNSPCFGLIFKKIKNSWIEMKKNDIYRGVMNRKHFNFYQKKEDEICSKMMKKNLWVFHIWYEKKIIKKIWLQISPKHGEFDILDKIWILQTILHKKVTFQICRTEINRLIKLLMTFVKLYVTEWVIAHSVM